LLFTHATKLVATLGAEAILIQAETVARLVAGQIRETVGPAEGDDPIKHYQSVLRDKTGSLIATSCRLGALLAGAPESTVDTLTEFGELIGICFQLSDDLLDVVADSDVSGKALGADLREGLATLPVLYALESRDPADVALHELLRDDLQDTHRLAEALKLLRIHPAIDRAREEVADYAAEAKALLKPLPDIPAKKALTLLCKAATYRSS
jgi:heptaprenyl diphosphate synthase